MIKVNSVRALQQAVAEARNERKTIGFVPTMGALHNGHISLVERAKEESSFVVVSLFVNPTQFNNLSDLDSYPRDEQRDAELVMSAGCDLLFIPSVEEMYPEPDSRIFDFGTLNSVLEGEFRPGHFNGVGQVVSKLFDMVIPDRAYFGQKDFQQLAVIKRLVELCRYDIDIISCKTVREDDGLAMSSRNLLLTPEHRAVAPSIYKILSEVRSKSGTITVQEAKHFVIESINAIPLLDVEYFDIVDDKTLVSLESWSECDTPVGTVAVFAGDVRLIDNILFN